MDSSSPVTPGDVVLKKYRVERLLGMGAMGIVAEATHLALDQRVAIKFMLPGKDTGGDQYARFIREARASVRLTTPHVTRVFDVGALDSGAPYMVMELLNGRDLDAVLKVRGPLPIDEAAELILQACEALAEAHAIGIVHRDLKPANLFLTKAKDGTPCVKVIDFGISKASHESLEAHAEGRDPRVAALHVAGADALVGGRGRAQRRLVARRDAVRARRRRPAVRREGHPGALRQGVVRGADAARDPQAGRARGVRAGRRAVPRERIGIGAGRAWPPSPRPSRLTRRRAPPCTSGAWRPPRPSLRGRQSSSGSPGHRAREAIHPPGAPRGRSYRRPARGGRGAARLRQLWGSRSACWSWARPVSWAGRCTASLCPPASRRACPGLQRRARRYPRRRATCRWPRPPRRSGPTRQLPWSRPRLRGPHGVCRRGSLRARARPQPRRHRRRSRSRTRTTSDREERASGRRFSAAAPAASPRPSTRRAPPASAGRPPSTWASRRARRGRAPPRGRSAG